MHDHSLGPMVDVGEDPKASHRGPCNDGVFGCSRCWDGANDGKGTVSECQWCHAKDVHTRITRASDEPVSYAVCEPCRARQQQALREEIENDPHYWDYRDSYEDDYDD